MPLKFLVQRGPTETIKKLPYRRWYMTVNDNAAEKVAYAYETPGGKGRRGLTFDQEIIKYGVRFDPEQYRAEYKHWVDFIYPMAHCESRGYFNAVNTWDRAVFTFGFVQMTALHANARFIKVFRTLLETQKAAEYFPDLSLKDTKGGKFIHRKTAEGKFIQLETKTDASRLQKYLNPSRASVEPEEADCAARFAHWATNEKEHRDIQVRATIEELKERLKNSYSKVFPLDGKPDYICLVVCDIRHQTRASADTIKAVFNAGGDDTKLYKGLINLGGTIYKTRGEELDKEIKKLIEKGALGKKKYDKKSNDFV